MFFKLPRAKVVDRTKFITEFCRGKNVIHLGAAQGSDDNDLDLFRKNISSEKYIHRVVSTVSRKAIGIDYNPFFIEEMKKSGFTNIFYGDIEKEETLEIKDFEPDVILLGEILEHLSNPGNAIKNILKKLATDKTTVLITIPNGLTFSNFIFALLGKESHDPDHSLLFTPRIISNLLNKNGAKVSDIFYTQTTIHTESFFVDYYYKKLRKLRTFLYWLMNNIFIRIQPAFAEGLIVLAHRKKQ